MLPSEITTFFIYDVGVDFICCDNAEHAEDYIPNQNWRDALKSICTKDPNILNIVVAHRETIRKLAEKKVNTPYCCVAIFQPHLTSEKRQHVKKASDKSKQAFVDEELVEGKAPCKSSESSGVKYEDSVESSLELQYKFISKIEKNKFPSKLRKK